MKELGLSVPPSGQGVEAPLSRLRQRADTSPPSAGEVRWKGEKEVYFELI